MRFDEQNGEIRGDDFKFLRLKKLTRPKKLVGKINVVDLFSGCGGISVGIREACYALKLDFNPLLAVDFFKPACECYKKNFPTADVRNIDISEILTLKIGEPIQESEKNTFSSFPKVDLLVGGPPCQGHSDLNNYTRRNDPKNHLYLYMLRAAEIIKPKHVIIENVMGAAHDKGHVVQKVCDHLIALGYKVSIGSIFMPDIGVPQTRRRLIVVASLTHKFDFDDLLSNVSFETRDLQWAIHDLMCCSGSGLLIDEAAKPDKNNKKRIDYLFDHNLYDLPNSERPHCHRDKSHGYTSIYGRLRWDKPSQTVTTGFYCMSMGRYVHPECRRTLTAHEAARLQFFPDYFDFSSAEARTGLATIIGNAVPSKLPYLIGKKLLQTRSIKGDS